MSSEAQTQRLFVALPVPEEVKRRVVEARNELRAALPPAAASWTRPENMHLTLRFLGNVEESKIELLKTSLTHALSGFGSIPLISERLGCFPDARHPRVVWAWVHDDAERLTQLHSRVAQASAAFTREPAESRFVGHITLARVRPIKRPQAESIASFVHDGVRRKFGQWTADHAELIRSELLPEGSRYTTIAGLPL